MPGTAGKPEARWRWLVQPNLADLFLLSLLAALFGRAEAWRGLLADGDTGWHIRTGEWILNHGVVPRADLFSFSLPGAPWFAWEWGADVMLARAYGWWGLEGVAVLTALTLCLGGLLLFCRMIGEGAGLWLAAGFALGAVSVSSIHYLARPHLFTLLLFPAALWILVADWRRPGPGVWWLVPLAAVWTNLHGGFVAWLAVLGLRVALSAAEHDRPAVRRYAWLAALSAAATLANPYGWGLHAHILRYLGSGWIQDNVQEFQSPRFRSESLLLYGALLLAAVALVPRRWARGERFEALLVMVWAAASLRSARHIPLFAVVAAPLAAAEAACWWRELAVRRAASSAGRILWDLSQELASAARRPSAWAAVTALAAWWLVPCLPDFPAERFPVEAVARHAEWLTPLGPPPRILTSDQWADYLIFRLYPRQRVFFDGRSDFYGPRIGADYQTLLGAGRSWRNALGRYRFDVALLPADWPLAEVLEREPGWRLVARDRQATLLIHGGGK